MTDIIEPVVTKAHPVGSGTQRMYRFDNGYGASVVQFTLGTYGLGGSYGAESGRWELAVLTFKDDSIDSFELTYATPITEDVLGHLTEDEVQETLRKIRDLPAVTA